MSASYNQSQPNGSMQSKRSLSRRLRRYNNAHRKLSGTPSISTNSTAVADYYDTAIELQRPKSLSCLTAATAEVTSAIASTSGIRRTPTGNSMSTTASLLSVVVVALVATSATGALLRCGDRRQVVHGVDSVRVVIRLPPSFRPGK